MEGVKIGVNLMPKERPFKVDTRVIVDNRGVELDREIVKPGGLYGANDYAMWVGANFYPTREDYVKEAEKLGCCKKVPHIPDGIDVGDSRIFLVHKEGSKERKPVVFGYFTLDGIIACTKLQAMIETVKKSLTGQQEYPVTALTANERTEIPLRGCGAIDPPSYYFVGPNDITCVRGYRKSVKNSQTRMVLLQEIPIKFLSRFRGLMRADKMFENAVLPDA